MKTAQKKVTDKDDTKSNTKKRPRKFLRLLFRQIAVFLVSVSLVVGMIFFAVNTLYIRILSPVNSAETEDVVIEIPIGSSLNRIANILYTNDLIRNTFAFEIIADFSDRAHRFRAGKYTFSRDMGMNQIMDRLLEGGVVPDQIRVTIREGLTISEMADYFATRFRFTAAEFIAAAKNVNDFASDFTFLNNIPQERKNSEFPLEGFLFPDTYFAYSNWSPEQVIRIMLRAFRDKVYTAEFQNVSLPDKARELGMSIDEVIVLASILQAESGAGEFAMVSAVFHNRLDMNMRLESCSTVLYVIPPEEREGPYTTAEQRRLESPFNTYLHYGLPLGPISAPGQDAIRAALFPYETFMQEDSRMIFFVLRGDGTHEFNTNYEDHANAVRRYEPLWRR